MLQSRATIKKGLYALIPTAGHVSNVIPGLEKCHVSILASPKLGAGFAAYQITAVSGGRTVVPFGKELDIELFLYVLKGSLHVNNGEKEGIISENCYFYAAPGTGASFHNMSTADTEFLIFKKRYRSVMKEKPWTIQGSVKEQFAGWKKEGLTCLELLPQEMVFDIGFYILIFYPGRSHGFIEIHDQEHGAYILSGEGTYYLNDKWFPVMQSDFIWMGPYVPQGAYSCGDEIFAYLYSKDCNRDIVI